MNKFYFRVFLTFLFILTLSCKHEDKPLVTTKNDKTPEGLLKLVKAYPDFLDSASGNNLYWKDGTVTQYDDGVQNKDYETLLNDPCLKDQMSQPYTKGADWSSPPAENFEPGRIRNEPFFMKMYGSSSGEVQGHLVSIDWMPKTAGKKIVITSVNGVADKLLAVSDELDELPADLKKYVTRLGGTFNWRVIAGTNRQSTHSFGIAIDINTTYSDYWQWDKSMTYHNKIPFEIVEIFERHGFIWGGKWYHYDTMHFEYRPELLVE